MDLTGYAGPKNGTLQDSCFQEVDIVKDEEIFRWCQRDHLSIDGTRIYMDIPGNTANLTGHTAGNGTAGRPWDYSHMNSVDLTDDGDYLVSIRHFDQIVKIAGLNNSHGLEAGNILWRLGGNASDFALTKEAYFTRQHLASASSTSQNETMVLLFNNAYEGANRASANHSSALLLRVNNETKEAVLEHEYAHPKGMLAGAEGSAQLLHNENVFVGWGTLPDLSEYQHDGTLLLHGRLMLEQTHSYRAFKSPWVGKPQYPPKLLAYRRSASSLISSTPLCAYVSWNGATEVRTWRFFVGNTTDGPWQFAGTFPKSGFETKARLQPGAATPWVSVEALDVDDNVIGEAYAKTFIPSWSARSECSEDGCVDGFEYVETNSCGDRCGGPPFRYIVFGVGSFILLLESIAYLLGGSLLHHIVPPSRKKRKYMLLHTGDG